MAPSDTRPNQSVIVSLAILKANWDYEGRSYADSFLPFATEALRALGKPSDLQSIQQHISQTFGIRIPQATLKSILRRAARSDLAVRRDGQYVPNMANLEHKDITPLRARALRTTEALVDKFLEYCFSQYQRTVSREDAERALLSYIEQRATPLLRTVLAESTGGSQGASSLSTNQLDYLVGAFCSHLTERDPTGFDYLETLVKGSMLASALYLPDVSTTERHFANITLYFDTPFLVDALGYNGPAAETSARELLELTYRLGAKLACFTDTVTEIHGILTAVASSLRYKTVNGVTSTQSGSIGEYFVEQGFRPSDIETLAARLDEDLKARRLSVLAPPEHSKELGVDEQAFARLLLEQVHYHREDALRHDLDALTAIFRLRKGARYPSIDHCKALFVTTNDSLARAGRMFFKIRETDCAVPLALLDHELSTLAWLKKPLSAPDLPRKQIIADSLAALQPSIAMWKRYLEQMQQLSDRGNVSKDDLVLLRYSIEARRTLMSTTLGDPSHVSPKTVVDALEAAKEAVATKAAADAAAEASIAVTKEQTEELARSRLARIDAESRAVASERALAEYVADRERAAVQRANRCAWWVSRAACTALAVVVVGSAFAATYPIATCSEKFAIGRFIPEWLISTWGRLGSISTFVGLLHEASKKVWGLSIGSLARSMELAIARRMAVFFRSL